MIEVLSHFLGFFIGFTITLGMIGSILHYYGIILESH